jgi:hypothetical protein
MKTTVSVRFGVLVTAVLLCGPSWAGENPSATAPASFAQTAQQCDKEIQIKIVALQEQYLKELSAVKQTYQGLGDLDKVLAVKSEQDRFTRSKTIAEQDVVEGPEQIRGLQEKYRTDLSQASRQVAQGYINRLLEAKKVLTRDDKLSDAVVVQKQIEVLARKYLASEEEPELIAPEPPTPPKTPAMSGAGSTRPKGLVVHFNFSDIDGKKVFSRVGGKVIQGKLLGDAGITTKGKRGSGLLLGADSGRVSFPDDDLPMASEPRTVALWFKTARRAHPQVLFEYGAAPSPSILYMMIYEDSNILTLGEYGNPYPRGRGHTNVTDGEWHHMALVYDGDWTATVYVDGESEFSTRCHYSTSPRGVGYVGGAKGDENFEGVIDEFMVFGKDLSAKEVKELYKSQK